ncbi:MAG: lysylphosphatidylglycerol synthase transmembrane domain-containing protein [Bacteroidota bacterium]
MILLKNIIKYTLFLGSGVLIFWLIYRDRDMEQFLNLIKNLEYKWLVVSVILGILAHVSRAFRWNMLIKPLGYRPKVYNSFLAVLVLYLTNLIIPRAGEITRCTVLTKYEKIPTSHLIGTVVTERIVDTLVLFLIAIVIFLTNSDIFVRFYTSHPEMQDNIKGLLTFKSIAIILFSVLFILGLLIFITKRFKNNKIFNKLRGTKKDFIKGIKSIKDVKNKPIFIAHTLFIFLMWLLMLYVVFWAYEPTKYLSLNVGAVTFLMGGLAMLAPVQGGIGPWHFMVRETLFLYGISRAHGEDFAFVAHSTTNLIYLVIGTIALIILPLVNLKRSKNDNLIKV